MLFIYISLKVGVYLETVIFHIFTLVFVNIDQCKDEH